ncbi:uncharacterized protein LOC108850354 [Raphanus sativus]|uniref:Uncharacterized protein LOC108850354 n=1 Tax=Raphanus sativus TaxID=3726 RepID=A0A6J0N5Q6_RAPSA|nr:uncharacterized protein LOC108850354 [Raphanus sativus]
MAAKIRVTIDGLKPLIKEAIVDFSSGEETIVTLEYEKLANHCQLCNSLLHEEQQCQNQSDQESYHHAPTTTNMTRQHSHLQLQAQTEHRPTAPPAQRKHHTAKEPYYEQRKQRNYSERLDRHGRPFGLRPSMRNDNLKNGQLQLRPTEGATKEKKADKEQAPSDSHSYRRERRSPPKHHITKEYVQKPLRLRDDSRRRSLSFGNHSTGSHTAGKEKNQRSEEEHISTPFTTPLQQRTTNEIEVQHLHENIMAELQDVTLQYVNVPDPIEREARRKRVLDTEAEDLMAKTAASMLAEAIKGNQNASNHAFYAALENVEEATLQEAREGEEAAPSQIETTQTPQAKKRGRPPGKTTAASRMKMMKATSSKKMKVIIQNSPQVRRSYSTNHTGDNQVGTRTTQRNKTQLPKGPAITEVTMREKGETSKAPQPPKANQKGTGKATTPKPKQADFQNPHRSLP